jgi:hypothetical protein
MLYSYRGAFHFFAWLGQAQPLLYYKCPWRGIVVAGLAPAMFATLRSLGATTILCLKQSRVCTGDNISLWIQHRSVLGLPS